MNSRKTTSIFTITLLSLMSLIAASCAPKNKKEVDCGFVQNSYGERVSWNSAVPVTFFIHDEFPTDLIPGLEAAAASWNKTAGRKLIQIETKAKVAGSIDPKKDTRNVIYYMNTWEEDRPTEQARTSIYWLGDQILEADIRINAKNFRFYDSQSPRSGTINFEALLLHEMGHALGLKHKETGGSVMATYLSSFDNRVQLSDSDSASLKCEYE